MPRNLDFLDKVRERMRSQIPAWMWLRMEELKHGHVIVQIGSVPWLPVEDWHETDCVSIDKGEVRIIAIAAKQPGTGAFRRLIDGILACGLRPVVCSPFPAMEAILERWGWQHTFVGQTFESWEHQWRPPPDWRPANDARPVSDKEPCDKPR